MESFRPVKISFQFRSSREDTIDFVADEEEEPFLAKGPISRSTICVIDFSAAKKNEGVLVSVLTFLDPK